MLNKIKAALRSASERIGEDLFYAEQTFLTELVPVIPRPILARMTWIIAGAISVYVYTAHLFTNEQSAEIWRSGQISLSLVVIIAYFRRAIRCFFVVGEWPERIDLISLGIVMSWTSVFCNGTWGMFWRLSGQPAWMVNNDLYQSWVMFNCIAASLHIMAPNILGHDVPVADRARLGGAFGLAMVLIVVLAVFRPDLSGVSESIRPYFETTFQEGAPPAALRFS